MSFVSQVRERYIVTGGVRLFAYEAGEGPLVLLVHGWPEIAWSWRHQVPALAEAGYRAVAVDLPGFGRSDKPDVSYDEQWVNTRLAGVITALGHERAVFVGHDWGSLLAWPFARRFSDRTAGVVGVSVPDIPRGPVSLVEALTAALPDTPPYIVQFQPYGPAEYVLGRDVRGWLEAMFRGPATQRPDAFPDEVIDRYVAAYEPVGAVTPPTEYYRAIHRNWELAGDLPETIAAPALFVMGTGDPVSVAASSEGMAERIPGLRDVVKIPECGHWVQQEQPEAFTRALVDFLDDLDPW